MVVIRVRFPVPAPENLMMTGKQEDKRVLYIIQLGFEIAVASGFALGLIPFVYASTAFWVIPLAIANLIISLNTKNKTETYTITNLILAVVSLIPVVGFATRTVGVIISIFSALRLADLIKDETPTKITKKTTVIKKKSTKKPVAKEKAKTAATKKNTKKVVAPKKKTATKKPTTKKRTSTKKSPTKKTTKPRTSTKKSTK